MDTGLPSADTPPRPRPHGTDALVDDFSITHAILVPAAAAAAPAREHRDRAKSSPSNCQCFPPPGLRAGTASYFPAFSSPPPPASLPSARNGDPARHRPSTNLGGSYIAATLPIDITAATATTTTRTVTIDITRALYMPHTHTHTLTPGFHRRHHLSPPSPPPPPPPHRDTHGDHHS